MFLGENEGFDSIKDFAELLCSVALHKCTFLYIKLEISPEQHILLIYHEIEQLDHQGFHLAHHFHIMKFTARKSRIQKDKSGCGGHRGRVNSTYMLIHAE